MPQPSFRLRPARPDDLSTLFAIDQACFPAEIAYSLEDLVWAMIEPNALTLVAESGDGALAGFLIGSRERPRVAHIITIDVLPKYRQQGIGNRLMEAAEHQFASQGADAVRLEAAVDNFPALRFYHRRGYQVVKTLPGYYPGGLDGLLLRKDGLQQELAAATTPGEGQ